MNPSPDTLSEAGFVYTGIVLTVYQLTIVKISPFLIEVYTHTNTLSSQGDAISRTDFTVTTH